VDHDDSAANLSRPPDWSLALRRRRAGEMNLPQAEPVRPVIKEGS
jgi:hypothetical protein